MAPGVVCKLLPQRGGSRPVNHSLTYFHYVRLPRSALLGSLDKPEDPRAAFFHNISRVAVGTIAIGSLGIPALQMSSFIAARYSQRRTIVNSAGERKPIIEFWTQKAPIVTAVARAFVMKAMHDKAVSLFLDPSLDYRVRHAIASIMKVVMIQHAQEAHLTLSERCGAQGLFEVNQLNAMHADMRGTAIAEGDLLGISVRLATELLLGRYEIPHTSDENSLLYKHEAGMFAELREHLHEIKNHRSVAYDRLVLPDSVPLVQAIGHRIAYDAAVAAGVDACLVDLYVATCIKLDPAWYLEELGIKRTAQKEMESSAIDAVYERLEEYLEKMDVESYVSAPLISDTAWNDYVRSLETFGDSTANVSKRHVPCSAGIVAKASFLSQSSSHI
ncbi:uncharacterized protein LAESUDRAFT_709568 [Laetiporus sulphureus 93-53]|uniref:Acyl-CoA oxidase C-alpha1 domain-containing protein n=1 Tax=Laetiporus sulphureus 93-53 TaxID=1314785 RepID=A0A165AYQ1_9APHY|nr:uncharacterized protein LAESUDRAFT_709568 [Laetiporus sulphureus 93-53]KZS99908.1 hypothetical protein LAESUDRAFT_709568 [Laetiporus sulphureus 93-53]